ncbi:MAG: DNA-directed RNA polymerase subunit alpha [Bacteroidetes bacterium]|nr:DNA-directed RNA polymerase subunit alpha [Bacteroidota bacterium]
MIYQIQMPEKVILEECNSQYHCNFIMQPLEVGYASTIGNALRRVLLSSIPGAAIVGVKISDVLQEFQSIPHVVEDVSEIILNLKEVKLKLTDSKVNKVQFHVEGPGTLTAKAIQDANSAVEVMDPNFHIATMSGKADFDVELRIEKGKGYVPSEEQVITEPTVGMLIIDAVFTPVLHVNYSVEPQRVGNRTDYERLLLEVKTDGTITAEEAVNIASSILVDHINLFRNELFFYEDDQTSSMLKLHKYDLTKPMDRERIKKVLLTPLKQIQFTMRTRNCLNAGIHGKFPETVADLVRYTENDLLNVKGLGTTSLTEIVTFLRMHSLNLGIDVDQYLNETAETNTEQQNEELNTEQINVEANTEQDAEQDTD